MSEALRSRQGVAAAALVLAFLVALPFAESAAAAPAVRDPEAARAALERAEAALSGPGRAGEARSARAPRDGADAGAPTVALRDLALALPALRGTERKRARRILARPTTGADPLGSNYSVPEEEPHCGERVCVHYVSGTADAPDLTDTGGVPGVPDYVERVAAVAEHALRVETQTLGWPAPIPDGARGGELDRTDVYLLDVGARGLYGYAVPDPPPEQNCVRRCFAYLVLDNDYAPAEFGYPDPEVPLTATAAHELNHVLQFAINAAQDGWMLESTAVWAEERVFPDADDYLSYVSIFAATPGIPITDFAGAGGLRVYGAAVWNHWLTSGGAGFGDAFLVDAWAGSLATRPRDFAVAAYQAAIRRAGGRGFSREFVRFAAATAEWRSGHGGFPDAAAYADVRRKGALRPRRRARWKRFKLDHTAYRLLRVRPGRSNRVGLRVRSRRGVRAGIGIVARDGTAVDGGVKRKTKMLRRAGRGSIRLRGARRFERITVVIVNADGRVDGFGAGDWRYRRDGVRFRVRLTR